MAITSTPYGVLMTDLGSAVHNFASDTDKVALLTNAYTPNFDTDASYADVVTHQVTGTNYTAGGITLANKVWAYDSGSNTTTLDADPVTWTNVTVTCRYAVVYKVSGSNATSKLIGLIDFGADRVYAGEPFQLSFPSGVVSIQPA